MSQTASQRPKQVLAAVVAVAVIAVLAVVVWRVTAGGDEATPTATSTSSEAATSTTPTPGATTATPKPKLTSKCEGPDTQFNLEGVDQKSLLPDCGVPAPVTQAEEKKSGLGLACGGSYPVILYKTTTAESKASICGTDATGAKFRFVTDISGKVVDLPGEYDGMADAFIARSDGSTYVIRAYDGSLVVKKDGRNSVQESKEFISLDATESDDD